MVKQRLPQSVSESRETKFVQQVEKDNLQSLTLDELANRFEEIEQQGQLLQGRILLEARNRFRSDKEFGQWCITHSICVSSQQHRNRLIHLARFFEGRELDKISISAAYEISAPINADIAKEVYEYAKGKNLPLAEIRKQIEIRKGVASDKPDTKIIASEKIEIIGHKEIEIVSNELEKTKVEIIMNDVLAGMTDGEKRHVLNDCLRTLSLYPAK